MGQLFNKKTSLVVLLAALTIILTATIYYSQNLSQSRELAKDNLREISENAPNKIHVQANYIVYENLEMLEEEVDAIVIAETTGITQNINHVKPNVSSLRVHYPFDGYTKTQIHVSEIVKMSDDKPQIKVNENIFVSEPNFSNEETMIIWDGYVNMTENNVYVLFLTWADHKQLYAVHGLHQGKYNIDHMSQEETVLAEQNSLYNDLKKEVINKYSEVIKKVMN